MALTDNILAYWKLDDDGSGNISLLDSTGNGNDLSNPNNAIETTGIINGGAGFGNGSQNNLITASGNRLPSENTWGSISAWFKADYVNNYDAVVFGDMYRNPLYCRLGQIDSQTCNLVAGLTNGSGDIYTGTISIGQWHHVVLCFDGSTATFYVDGNLVANTNASGGGGFAGGGFSLGSTGDNFGGNYQFNGTIDEVGIWTRVLTSDEVVSLYNSGTGNTYPFGGTAQTNAFLKIKPTASSNLLLDNILAYWKLDDTSWSDSTGNGHNLNNSGGITLSTGKINGDAVTDGYSFLNNTSFTTSPTSPESISLWVKSSNFNGGAGYGCIASDMNSGFQIIGNSDGTIKLASWNSSYGEQNITTSTSLTDNTWHHVVGIRNLTTLSFYVDGTLIDSITCNTSNGYSPWNNGCFQLLAYPDINGNCANETSVDEVGVWSRALTSDEVTALYNSGTGKTYPFASDPLTNNILAYWKLDDTSWSDSTGNGITLTDNNGVTLGTGIISNDAVISTSTGSYLQNTTDNFNIGTGDVSISVWVNPSDYGSGGYSDLLGAIFDLRSNGGGHEWLGIFNTSGNIIIWQTPASYQTTAVIPLNTWTNIALSRSSGTTSVYINGSLDGTFTDSYSFVSTIVTIGGVVDSPGTPNYLHFNGGIDEVGVWGRALTPQEVTDLYNGGIGKTYPFGDTVPINAFLKIKPTASSNQLLDSIQAYWNLNDDGSGNISLQDSTGNGNDLSNPNGAIETTGIINGGAGFGNGNTNNLVTASGNRFPSENTWGSVSAWFKTTSLTSGVIFGDYYRNPLVLNLDGTGALQARLGNGGGGSEQVTTSISTDTWYHAVITYDGTTFTLYLNGSQVGQTTIDWSGQSYQPNGFSLASAWDNPGGSYQFNGTIDEVGVWSRALTFDEVVSLYNSGTGKTYPFGGTAQTNAFFKIRRV